MYAYCEVQYAGRAVSYLKPGNYLITHKSDGSLLIHNGENITPCNYQGPGSKLRLESDTLISQRKKEIIKIKILNLIHFSPLSEWSNNKIEIQKTELELVKKFVANWDTYITSPVATIETEYKTPVGSIDIIGIEIKGCKHVVEVKRKTATIKDCTQLKRYVDYFGIGTAGYLASPNISQNARTYLGGCGFSWICIDFE